MPSLKSLGIVCALGASALLGCTTYSADLQKAATSTTQPVSLQSHHWALQKVLTSTGTPDSQWQIPANSNYPARAIEVDFSHDQSINVSNLCNNLRGGYSVDGQRIKITRFISTMMACDQALMQLEGNVAKQLPQATTWKILPQKTPILELRFEGGSVWQLQGTPTHETLYGSSTRVFLEVAAQKVTCDLPGMQNAQCLQVRELKYNEQGIKESSGDWMPYTGTIEGYTHQPGVRNVLRLKRFSNPQAAANAFPFVDVVDLVVESEIQR